MPLQDPLRAPLTGQDQAFDEGVFGHDDSNDADAAPVSRVRFGNGEEDICRNGRKTVSGEVMTVVEVAARAFAQAVPGHTADLQYRDRSGVLDGPYGQEAAVDSLTTASARQE